jgi:hypothetical protein
MDRAPSLEPGLLPLPRPLMAGEMLDAAFRLFRASLLRCLPYSGLTVLLMQVPTLYATLAASGSPAMRVTRFAGRPAVTNSFPDDRTLVHLVVLLFGVLLIGALTLRMHAVSRGVRPRFRTEIPTALRRWPAAIIATTGALVFPLILAFAASLVSSMMPGEVLLVLGAPLLWPTAILAPALPAFWCDGLGPFAAIARSVRIGRRGTWRLVGAMFTTLCIVLVFYVLCAIAVALLSPALGSADLVVIAVVTSLLWIVFGAIGVPFVLAVLVVAYEDLKLRDAERHGVRA